MNRASRCRDLFADSGSAEFVGSATVNLNEEKVWNPRAQRECDFHQLRREVARSLLLDRP